MKKACLLFFLLGVLPISRAQDTIRYGNFGVANRDRLPETCYWLTKRTDSETMKTLHLVADYNAIRQRLPDTDSIVVECYLTADRLSGLGYRYGGTAVAVNAFGQYSSEKTVVIAASEDDEAPYLDVTYFDEGSKINLFKADLDSNRVRIYTQVHGHRSGKYVAYTLAGQVLVLGEYGFDNTQKVAVKCGVWQYFENGVCTRTEQFGACR